MPYRHIILWKTEKINKKERFRVKNVRFKDLIAVFRVLQIRAYKVQLFCALQVQNILKELFLCIQD